MNIVSLNHKNPSKFVQVSSYLSNLGDLLRLLCLYYLSSFIFNKKASAFKIFLIIYAISSVFIGFFAWNNGHLIRGFSEYILAIGFAYFYFIY
jgi:hypothetical protein